MAKKKRFNIQLGIPGLIFSVGLLICLFLWTFVLGFYLGQKRMASRVEKMSSPVTQKALKGKKEKKVASIKPPPVYEEVSPPPLVGEKVAKGPEEQESEKEARISQVVHEAAHEIGIKKKPEEAKKVPSPEEKKASEKAGAAKVAKVEPPQAKPEAEKPKPAAKSAPAEAAQPAPSSPKVQGPFYSVQVSSLKNIIEAQKYVNYLRERGYEAFIKRVTLPQKGTWYRVYVGRFKSFAEARKFGEELKRREKIKSFYVQKLGASK